MMLYPSSLPCEYAWRALAERGGTQGEIVMLTSIRALAFVSACLATSAAAADPNIIVFDPPDSVGGSSAALQGLDKKGEVFGAYDDNQSHLHIYLRKKNGSFVTLGDTGDNPMAVNDKQVVTGQYGDGTGSHGFVLAKDGSVAHFDAPGANGSGLGTLPLAIDNKGDVAGIWGTTAFVRHGFVRDPDGTLTAFDATGAGTASGQGTYVQSINVKGIVAGYYIDGANAFHGFLRSRKGAFTKIDAAGAGSGASMGTQILAINGKGAVSGIFFDSGGSHGFLIDAHGTQTTFDIPHRSNMLVTGMNSGNDIVGYYDDNSLGLERAFVRAASGDLTVFDVFSGDQGTFAYDINDKGEIAGVYVDAGAGHSWLRTP
jgi:hypothetical protein